MIELIVLAVVVACIVGLACLLLGAILKILPIPIAVAVGEFFEKWAWVIGVLAGLVYFATGGRFKL